MELQLDKKKLTILAASLITTLAGMYSAYAWLPLATGGTHSITQKDVSAYRAAMRKLVETTGEGEVPSREDALKAMATTFAQMDLLQKKGVTLDREKANLVVQDSSPLKGVLKSLKQELGEDRYFYTVTLPATIGRPFLSYYNAADPKSVKAQEILRDAMSTTIHSAAQKAGLQAQEMEIRMTPENNEFFNVAGKSIGKVIDKVVDNGTSLLVIEPKEKLEGKVTALAINIPKTPPAEFFRAQMAANGIKLQVKPWTLYADNKFFPTPEPAKKAEQPAAEGDSNAKK